jgi:taurine transport system permease protein
VVTVVLLLALWWLATHLGWIRICSCRRREDFQRLRERLKATFRAAALPEHFMWSMMRVFGVLLAVLTAVPVGVAMGVSRVMRGIFDPPIEFYRPLPPLAYLPLIVIWFGIDETPRSADLPGLLRAAGDGRRAGVRSVTIEQIAAYSMGASRGR